MSNQNHDVDPIAKAKKALKEFYLSRNADTIEKKISALEDVLGGPSNYYALGGEVTDEMKLGCLEYEYLSACGLIELVLV